MRLLDAALLPYAIPLRRAYRSARGRHTDRRGYLFRLEGPDRIVGIGEAAPLDDRTETLDGARAALEAVVRWVRSGAHGAEELLARLPPPGGSRDRDRAAQPPGPLPELHGAPAARAAVATALFDLLSRREELPLHRWLADRWTGGRRPPAWVPVNAVLPGAPPERLARAAAEAVRRGFRCLKLKVGLDDGTDVAGARAVRAAVGAGVGIRLDANGAWSFEQARERLRELEPLHIEYVEQPLPAAEYGAMARLRAISPIAVAADEAVRDPFSARRLVEAGAADVLVLKPAVLGGPDVALEIAHDVEVAGIAAVVTSALDGVTGRLAALHTVAALGPRPRASGLATGTLLSHEVARGEERLERGRLLVPDAPGLGAYWPEEPGAPPTATRTIGP
ncbi:MAG: mandelate racemase/muconate lactonizing enzyme family protein [Gemmatimonadota bacterium]